MQENESISSSTNARSNWLEALFRPVTVFIQALQPVLPKLKNTHILKLTIAILYTIIILAVFAFEVFLRSGNITVVLALILATIFMLILLLINFYFIRVLEAVAVVVFLIGSIVLLWKFLVG